MKRKNVDVKLIAGVINIHGLSKYQTLEFFHRYS